eukprot:5750004-Pleurochrysis_carterae.AAC.1
MVKTVGARLAAEVNRTEAMVETKALDAGAVAMPVVETRGILVVAMGAEELEDGKLEVERAEVRAMAVGSVVNDSETEEMAAEAEVVSMEVTVEMGEAPMVAVAMAAAMTAVVAMEVEAGLAAAAAVKAAAAAA